MIRHKKQALHAVLLATGLLAGSASASELIYHPRNPSFGGNPLNGSILLNQAQITSHHEPPDVGADGLGIEQKTPLEIFNETLERSILAQMASAASSRIIGPDGKFVPGTLETINYIITVKDMGTYMEITTTDKVTGAQVTTQTGTGILQ
ncbi:curli assembly protein CsgF [Pusillimonas sp. TS35]|jgi:curli production assembly/transport component CsgF|uniref:curli assembly protein CsgF n=1 Tax=Paracandidimonas lactea TaxID=2895524 RepID=UPI00136CDC29|nr:curli assembly protein CsgF [Paracandidimonas lactea]MYN12053.1 curli assembly protein CsgF [Pusillimonas sp. TS35]